MISRTELINNEELADIDALLSDYREGRWGAQAGTTAVMPEAIASAFGVLKLVNKGFKRC